MSAHISYYMKCFFEVVFGHSVIIVVTKRLGKILESVVVSNNFFVGFSEFHCFALLFPFFWGYSLDGGVGC